MTELDIDQLRQRLDAHERRLITLRSTRDDLTGRTPPGKTSIDDDLATLHARRRAIEMCQAFLTDPTPATYSAGPQAGPAAVRRLAEWLLDVFADAYPNLPDPELN